MPRFLETNVLKKYNIDKHRMFEIYHFALQYNKWNAILESNQADEDLKTACSTKIKMVVDAVNECDPKLAKYILKLVTEENVTYDELVECGLECSKDELSRLRNKFYIIIDKWKS